MTLRIFRRIAIRLASHSARRHDSDENRRGWYGGGGGKFKKFSGFQSKIWKKLFTRMVHPHGVDSGALAFVRLYVSNVIHDRAERPLRRVRRGC